MRSRMMKMILSLICSIESIIFGLVGDVLFVLLIDVFSATVGTTYRKSDNSCHCVSHYYSTRVQYIDKAKLTFGRAVFLNDTRIFSYKAPSTFDHAWRY